jgi:hypothetical protein
MGVDAGQQERGEADQLGQQRAAGFGGGVEERGCWGGVFFVFFAML